MKQLMMQSEKLEQKELLMVNFEMESEVIMVDWVTFRMMNLMMTIMESLIEKNVKEF